MLAIINSIAKVLIEEGGYTDEPQYVDDIPQDFKRPSFLLEKVDDGTQALNKWVISNNHIYEVTKFLEKDRRGNIDSVNAYNELENLKKLFRKGYFEIVGTDRVAKLDEDNGVKGVKLDDEIKLILTLNFTEDRSSDFLTEDYELMGNLQLKVNN